MKMSTERILTTHTGSLPRSPELTTALLQRDRTGTVGERLAALTEVEEFPEYAPSVGRLEPATPACVGPVAHRDPDAVRAHDVPLRDIMDLVVAARPSAISFEAANPRHAHEWAVFDDVPPPGGGGSGSPAGSDAEMMWPCSIIWESSAPTCQRAARSTTPCSSRSGRVG
jgi:hypothetical protein